MSKSCGRVNEVKIHWVPGRKDIAGIELANRQANYSKSRLKSELCIF